jgi:hypothetical protein
VKVSNVKITYEFIAREIKIKEFPYENFTYDFT